MGSSLTSQQSTPFIQIDPTEHCQLVTQTGQYQVFENHRGEQYQKYLVNQGVQENKLGQNKSSYPKNYLENRPSFQDNYQYRLTHRSKYFVQLLYASPRQTPFSCNFNNKKGDYDVVTQRITHRLNDMYNLSFQNAITILNISLKGFKNLFNYNGTLWIKDSMIGVNQNSQVRVWLNTNYALNIIEPLPISLVKLTVQAQQDLIVNNLIDMISSKTYPSAQWKELMRLRMQIMADSRIKSMNNNQQQTDNGHPNQYHHQSINSSLSFRANQLHNNTNSNSKVTEYDQNNTNRMTFDLALQMVDAIFIRFAMQQLRENNKVYDLFSEGKNTQMIRQLNPQTNHNSNSKSMISTQTIDGNNKHVDQHPTNTINKPSVYPSRMKQIKSHTNIENHLIHKQMNGKQMYQLNNNIMQLHTIPQMSVNIQHQKHPSNTSSSQPQTIHQRVSQVKESRQFHNPFIDNKVHNLNNAVRRQSMEIVERAPINPFVEVLKTRQAQRISANQGQSYEINTGQRIYQKNNSNNHNSFKQIRTSIIAPVYGQIAPVSGQIAPVSGQISPASGQISPVYGQNIRMANNNNNVQNEPNKLNHVISQSSMQQKTSHPNLRVSFNNNTTENSSNLTRLSQYNSKSTNQLVPMRQNSFLNNKNGQNSVKYLSSSLSQSPQTMVRFNSNSVDKRHNLSYAVGNANQLNNRVCGNGGSRMRVFPYDSLGNPLIQRRSTAVNFSHMNQHHSNNQVVRPIQTHLTSLVNQQFITNHNQPSVSNNNNKPFESNNNNQPFVSSNNMSQQQLNNMHSPIHNVDKRIIQPNQRQINKDNSANNKIQLNKPTISQSIIVMDKQKHRDKSDSIESQQVISQKILLVSRKSQQYINQTQPQKHLQPSPNHLYHVVNTQRQQLSNSDLDQPQTQLNHVQYLRPDEQQQWPLTLSLTPNKQQYDRLTPNKQSYYQPQINITLSQENLNYQQLSPQTLRKQQHHDQQSQTNQQPYNQQVSVAQPPSKSTTNLMVVTSYNQQQSNEPTMQISIKHCPTPDGSFIKDQSNESISDIPYDQRQDHIIMETNHNEYGLEPQSNGYIMETGKFIYHNTSGSKYDNSSGSKEGSRQNSFHNKKNNQKQQQYQQQTANKYFQDENTLSKQVKSSLNNHNNNIIMNHHNNQNNNHSHHQQLTHNNMSHNSSNQLVINGSTQTNKQITYSNNNITTSSNSDNSKNIVKSNTSSQGMYKYELRDTVNLFSLNHINHLAQNSNNSLKAQSDSYDNNDSTGNARLKTHMKKGESIQWQKGESIQKESLYGSQANTIINKLKKWDSNKLDNNHQQGKFNIAPYQQGKFNTAANTYYNMANSQQIQNHNSFYHFNVVNKEGRNKKDDFTQGSKVQKIIKRHSPFTQNNYAQSMAQQHQIVEGENGIKQPEFNKKDYQKINSEYNKNYYQMIKTSNNNDKESYGSSYMNSSYFSNYFNNKIKPQSTRQNNQEQPRKFPLFNQKQLSYEKQLNYDEKVTKKKQLNNDGKQNIQLPIINENLTYKQLRNLLNPSNPTNEHS